MIVKNVDKTIQQTLKNRERALGRKVLPDGVPVNSDAINITDMASRTVFVRMISNRSKPVVLQGAELKPNQTVAEASTDADGNPIAASTDLKSQFGFNNVYKKTSDGTIRYLSGIKDISVEYKGGYKAIRTANVNWTAASLDDLDRLTPHFLTAGLSVLLDWGWVMKDSPPSTFFNDGKIDSDAFKNPIPKIINDNKGNYDALAGTVSNFNYKLNEDGTFDCSTTITGMGINLFESMSTDKGSRSQVKVKEVSDNEGDSEEKIAILKDGLVNSIINLPRIIIHEVFGLAYDAKMEKEFDLSGDYDSLIDWSNQDLSINLAAKFLSFSSKYIITEQNDSTNSSLKIDRFNSEESDNMALDHYIAYIPKETDKFESDVIFAKSDYDSNVREDFFVRWGWFEDNILSRYTSLYADNEDGELMNQFRSIDTALSTSSEVTKQSVKIRNNESLHFPKDTFKFILPGQHIATSEILDIGDQWNTDENNLFKFVDKLFKMNNDSLKFSVADNKEEGYLRNVMVNVKEIQTAFGIKNPDSMNENEEIGKFYGPDFVEPVSTVHEGVMNLAKSLSKNYFDFWDFKIVPDTYSDNIKLIDSDQTEAATSYEYTKFQENSHEVQNLGLYKFPTFQAGSIVKSQTMESKIIDALTITTMYGSNQDKNNRVKLDMTNQSPRNQLLFSKDVGDEYKDEYLNQIQKAYMKILEKDKTTKNKIGNSNSDPNVPITIDGGFQIDSNVNWWSSWSEENRDKDFRDKVGEYLKNIVQEVKNFYIKGLDAVQSVVDLIDEKTEKGVIALDDDGALVNPVFDGEGMTAAIEQTANKGFEYVAQGINNGIKATGDYIGEEGTKTIDVLRKVVDVKAIEKVIAYISGKSTGNIKDFKKGDKIYIFNGDADNGEQYELTLTDEYVPLIKSKLYFDGDKADQTKTPYLNPIELSLEIDGIGGLLPGEIIQSDYMPKKYNVEFKDGKNQNVGPFVFFQMFDITQKVGLDGWFTEIGTKMRVNNRALDAITWNYVDSEPLPEGTRPDTSVPSAEVDLPLIKLHELDFDDFNYIEAPNPTTYPKVKVTKLLELKKAIEIAEIPTKTPAQQSTKSNDTSKLNLGSNTTYKGLSKQNEIIYKLVPAWRPPEAGGAKETSFYTELSNSKIPIIVRQLFWDNYVEMPNGNGQSKATASTILPSGGDALVLWPTAPSDLVNYDFKQAAGVQSKAGKYNTMSYTTSALNAEGKLIKVKFGVGSRIYLPNPL